MKVLAEHARLFQVATGRALPPPEPRIIPAAAPADTAPVLSPVQSKADDTLVSLSRSTS